MRLQRLGEHGLIRRIRHTIGSGGPGIHVGIGDDAAVLQPTPGAWLLATTDLVIEDVHFRRRSAGPACSGRGAFGRWPSRFGQPRSRILFPFGHPDLARFQLDVDDRSDRVGSDVLAGSVDRDNFNGTRARLLALANVFRDMPKGSPVPGGCPVQNTAVVADDAHPLLLERARQTMNEWRGAIRRIVERGIERGEIRPETNPDTLATLQAAHRVVAALLGGPCAECGRDLTPAIRVGPLCRPCYVRQRRHDPAGATLAEEG